MQRTATDSEKAMSSTPQSPPDLRIRQATPVPVECLKFDCDNPRLTGAGSFATEEQIIARLYRAEDLGELLQSIGVNGYLDIEPFVVLKCSDRYTVLEGNRRLAAIRLFREPDLVTRISRDELLDIKTPELPDKHRRSLDKISVYRVATREEAAPFIGFKHINGAARWSSYAKAKFAARWHSEGGVPIEKISGHIGDRHATVKRMVSAIYVLEQAEQASLFCLDDRNTARFSFSHLYTALARPAYRRYLGLNANWSSYDPVPNPVGDAYTERLADLLRWIYGSKQGDVDPVVQSQNPDIKRLGEVLDSKEGLAILKASRSLDEAYDSTLPAKSKFLEALLQTRKKLREASHHLRGFDGREASYVNIAEDISETAQAIHARMKKKMETAIKAE